VLFCVVCMDFVECCTVLFAVSNYGSVCSVRYYARLLAACGFWGCKNGPAAFPGQMLYKVTKPGVVSVLYLSKFFLYSVGVY